LIKDTYAKYTKLDGPQTINGPEFEPFVGERVSIPPDFVDTIIKNIKMFLFAGHETTSTTISMMCISCCPPIPISLRLCVPSTMLSLVQARPEVSARYGKLQDP
jgi:hypothetical protein